MRPRRATVSRVARVTSASRATSQASASTAPPCASSSRRAASLRSASRAQIATLAPARSRPRAMPSPMPRLPPVTTATRPCRSKSPTPRGRVSRAPLRLRREETRSPPRSRLRQLAADALPAAVGLAAGAAGGLLGLPADAHRRRVLAAVAAVLLPGARGRHLIGGVVVGVAPGHAALRAGGREHLPDAALVELVDRVPDRAADEDPEQRAARDRGRALLAVRDLGGDRAAGRAAERRAEQRAVADAARDAIGRDVVDAPLVVLAAV